MNLILGDALAQLHELPDETVQCCVTSPPYWGLRDYGVEGQIGNEKSPQGYIAKLVDVFREVRRALKPDGTLWLVIGDSYIRTGGWSSNAGLDGCKRGESDRARTGIQTGRKGQKRPAGLKEKEIAGIPWRVAFALQADGWLLRQDIIWRKPNPLPESVQDRCTKAHEYIFLMTKSARYYFDAKAIKEECTEDMKRRAAKGHTRGAAGKLAPNRQDHDSIRGKDAQKIKVDAGRNRHSVWTIPVASFSAGHFAVYPTALAEICIRAGSRHGDVVLDPFLGSGTTGLVARVLGREFIGIEINGKYLTMASQRIERGYAPAAMGAELPLFKDPKEDNSG